MFTRSSLLGLVLVTATAATETLSAQARPAESASFVIRGAKVFDGVRDLGIADVLVTGDRITAIGRTLRVPARATEIDARGKTLLPGFIDAHVHAYGDAMRTALVYGSTTLLDQFTDITMASGIRTRQANGEMNDVADLYSAGTLVTSPKGHGTEYGMVIPTISSPAEAQAFVDARLAEGSQWIKIVYDNGSTYGMTVATISRETMQAVIAATHRRGKLAVVHIGDLAGAREAIEAGADGLAHLFVDADPDTAFGALLKQHRAFVIPTLSVLESVSSTASGATLVTDAALSPWVTQAAATNLKTGFPRRAGSRAQYSHAVATIRALKAAGVPILAGTDAPNPGTWHGISMHREVQLLVEAGLTPIEALASATSIPAAKFRFTDRGRIARGLRADLLLVDGDPLTDIRATRAIAGVWKRGVAVDRAPDRESVVAESRAAAAAASAPSASLIAGDVSDFESGKPDAKIGFGWVVSTDAFAGGKSVAAMNVVDGGANGSAKALSITGTLDAGLSYGWSGAMLLTGKVPMQPADFSSKKELRFFAKGDGQTYTVMLFSQSRGQQPLTKTFVSTTGWTEVVMPFSDFGVDAHDVQGLAWTLTGRPGTFALQVDDVRLR
jgi:imidazolonepropionase-like amidohydrolase